MMEADARVRVLARRTAGHCRTPLYLKGREGIVVSVPGTFRNPELLAYHKPGLPARRLCKVRFRLTDLWPDYRGATGDTLEADLYEHWLERVGEDLSK